MRFSLSVFLKKVDVKAGVSHNFKGILIDIFLISPHSIASLKVLIFKVCCAIGLDIKSYILHQCWRLERDDTY